MDVLRKESKEAQGRTSGAWFAAEDALDKKLIDEIVPVEDFLDKKAKELAKEQKVKEIEIVRYEKNLSISDQFSKKTEAIFRAMTRVVVEEFSGKKAHIRAE